MSSIASLFNIPGTPEELLVWSHAHAAHHRDISTKIFQLTGEKIVDFVLDPIAPSAIESWLDQHQLIHQQMDAILGIAGFDLQDVDWEDQAQFAGWVFLHATEHREASDILGVG